MIQLRKNPFSETQIDIPFVEGESAKELVERALAANGYEISENVLWHFHVVINGLVIEKEMWPLCKIEEKDTVLIAPKIARGDGAQLFKTIAIIVIAVAASVAFGPVAGMTAGQALGASLIVAGITVAGTLALNALIPPPGLPGLGGLGSEGSSFEGSQMYTITSQQNNAKKFGYVPKVYGNHRMFPLIAANPYTELEADPVTGNLVQYYYAIFDFGFGPAQISDIRIGDSSITQYTDANWRLVDLNKPAIGEGPWDDLLHESFQFYKGDVERDGTQVEIDKNSTDVGVTVSDYQFVRNASDNTQGSNQEIILDFAAPSGLQAYATTGDKGARSIDLKIEFSKVGEDVWRSFNDSSFVDDFGVAGGENPYSDKYVSVAPLSSFLGGPGYTYLGNRFQSVRWPPGGTWTAYHSGYVEVRKYGYAAGDTRILLQTASMAGFAEEDLLYFSGNRLGKIINVEASGFAGYSWYYLDTPLKTSYLIIEVPVPPFPSSMKLATTNSLSDKVYLKKYSFGLARITANTPNQYYASVRFKPKGVNAFKVRVTRINSFSSYTYQVVDKLALINISTRFDRNPILTDKRHVFLEVKIKATNQLSGSISNLSAIVDSVLDVYDTNTDTWVKQVSNNPAWVFADLLTGELNKKAISKSRLHVPSLVEWAQFCDEVPLSPPSKPYVFPRFTCNFVLDFDTTLQSILSTVANASQASLNIIDGKYGVLIDKKRTVPVQIFTPRNSSGFSSTRSYDVSPHALNISYVDPLKNWDVTEIVIYDEGYDQNNATEFDSLSTFGCTSDEQAFRFGRYMIAQARLRKERITIEVDFEYLVCTRGDYVQITQDVMKVGGRPARVKEITGVDTVKIDDAIDTIPTLSYAYVYRNEDGIQTSSCDVIDSDEFKLYGPMPRVGDLIIVGESGKVVFDCIVKSISPSTDLKATLELVEKADGVYAVESSDDFPDYNPQLNTNIDSNLAAPPAVENLEVVSNSWRVSGGAYQYYIDLDWDVSPGAAVDLYEIYVDSGRGYNLVDSTKESQYEYLVDPRNLGLLHNFKVLGVSSTGKKISLLDAPTVSATPLAKIAPPSNVPSLAMNITKEVLQLDWKPIPDLDLKEYLIRYSANTTTATWESSIPLMKADKNATSAATQGRTGTYFIKAVDLNGNQSEDAAQARTTIPNLFDLNVIDQTNDFPDLNGELVAVEKDGTGLVLQRLVSGGVTTNQYYSEGYYYYDRLLDLGDIYTVRLQSLIEAEGFTVGDLMVNWATLDTVNYLVNAGSSDWDVETQWRGTASYNVMAEWSALDEVDPISLGDVDNWTPWRKFTIGDVTARIMQFRLKLISNKIDVTPRVFSGVIKSDMPDRTDIYNNLTATPSGFLVVYDPAFMGPGTTPNIQITQDNAQSGDYYLIESKSLNGFKITFYDNTNVAVTRQFDVAVKGYGRKSLAVI